MYTTQDRALLLAACQRAGLPVVQINPIGFFAVLPSTPSVLRQRAANLLAAFGDHPAVTVRRLAELHQQYLTATAELLSLAGQPVAAGEHPKIEDAQYPAIAAAAYAASVPQASTLSTTLLYLWQTIAASDPEGREGAWDRIAWHDPLPEVVADAIISTPTAAPGNP